VLGWVLALDFFNAKLSGGFDYFTLSGNVRKGGRFLVRQVVEIVGADLLIDEGKHVINPKFILKF